MAKGRYLLSSAGDATCLISGKGSVQIFRIFGERLSECSRIADCHVGGSQTVRGSWVRSLPQQHHSPESPGGDRLPIVDGIDEGRARFLPPTNVVLMAKCHRFCAFTRKEPAF